MEKDRKQLIKDKFVLEEIKKSINNQTGISIVHIYYSSDICEDFLKLLKEIYKITYPISITKKGGGEKIEYIKYLYKYLDLPINNYNWLIPNFNGSSWWIEIKVIELNNFINFYYSDSSSINLTAFDTNNKILFDIEYGENDYEYRIIEL